MSRVIKVLQVVHSMPVAGTEKLVYDMIKLFPDHLSFAVCCLDNLGVLGDELKKDNIPIFCVDRQPGRDWSLPSRIARIVKDLNIDIIHAHQYTPFFYSALSRYVTPSPKLVFTEHGRHFPDIDKLKRKLFNQILNVVTNQVTGVSRFSCNQIVKYEWLPRRKMKVIYNGIDLERFKNLKDKNELVKELEIDPACRVVGYVGRLHPIKDPLMLIRAFAEVRHELENVMLLIIGDGEMSQDCKELASELKIAENVKFLGLRRDIPDLLQVIDVLVLSSLTEATSVTLLEGMASGLPIACTEVGGNPEIVVHNETGLLSPREDFEALGKNLIKLIKDSHE